MWVLELLGGLKARSGDRCVERFRTQKTGQLLAYLALHPRQAHSRETLADLIWPECDTESGLANVSRELYSLRRALATEPGGDAPKAAGSPILTDRGRLRLDPQAATTDVALFEAVLDAAGSDRERDSRRRHLERAVGLYAGELLHGMDEDWVVGERARLAERYAEAALQLVAVLAGDGSLDDAVRVAQHAIALDPLREELHRELIRLHARLDRPTAAKRQYAALERLLDELGAKPARSTRTLVDALEQTGWTYGPREGAPADGRRDHSDTADGRRDPSDDAARVEPRLAPGRPAAPHDAPPTGGATAVADAVAAPTDDPGAAALRTAARPVTSPTGERPGDPASREDETSAAPDSRRRSGEDGAWPGRRGRLTGMLAALSMACGLVWLAVVHRSGPHAAGRRPAAGGMHATHGTALPGSGRLPNARRAQPTPASSNDPGRLADAGTAMLDRPLPFIGPLRPASVSGPQRPAPSATARDAAPHPAAPGPRPEVALPSGEGAAGGIRPTVGDPRVPQWRDVEPLPDDCVRTAAVTATDGRIYVIGGDAAGTPSGGSSPDHRGASSDAVNLYDPRKNSWSHVQHLIMPRAGAAAARGPDGCIYAIGGHDGKDFLDSVERYDPRTDRWSVVHPLRLARRDAAAVTGPDGWIYVIGGTAHDTAALTSVEAYDTATGYWTIVPPLPNPARGASAAVGPDGRIYVFGGIASPYVPSSTVQVLDPRDYAAGWRQITTYHIGRFGAGAAVGPDGRIYLLGGTYNYTATYNAVEVFDPRTGRWSESDPMRAARKWLGVAAAGRYIYAIGGADAGDGGSSGSAEAYGPIPANRLLPAVRAPHPKPFRSPYWDLNQEYPVVHGRLTLPAHAREPVEHIRNVEVRTAMLPDGAMATGFFLTVDLSKPFWIRNYDVMYSHWEAIPGDMRAEVYSVPIEPDLPYELCAALGTDLAHDEQVRFKALNDKRCAGYFVVVRVGPPGRRSYLAPRTLIRLDRGNGYAAMRFWDGHGRRCVLRWSLV